MTLPCVGAGITVLDPGFNADVAVFERGRGGFMKMRKPPKQRGTRGQLLRAYVVEVREGTKLGDQIWWQCGKRRNYVCAHDEGGTWIHGHGEQARHALLTMRVMR